MFNHHSHIRTLSSAPFTHHHYAFRVERRSLITNKNAYGVLKLVYATGYWTIFVVGMLFAGYLTLSGNPFGGGLVFIFTIVLGLLFGTQMEKFTVLKTSLKLHFSSGVHTVISGSEGEITEIKKAIGDALAAN